MINVVQTVKFAISHATICVAMIVTMIVPVTVQANTYYVTTSDNTFDEIVFAIESAIIDRGLVIDFQGDSGSMLARTAEVNESDSPYGNARYFNFCSSSLTHSAVTANAENIAICPYVVYAYQLNDSPETTHIGYRKPAGVGDEASEGILREIEALLRSIVDEATY